VINLFLAGDVMTGRGIDQILPYPNDPRLQEPYVRDARDYVALAEAMNGKIPRPVDYSYIWGVAIDVLDDMEPDAKIINLETSITTSNDYSPDKAIHYRMHPHNVGCLTAAGIECCVTANNHVLDFGYTGLAETLETLRTGGLAITGAGPNSGEAFAPAVIDLGGKGRILVFALGVESSGIPLGWRATETLPGVNLVGDLSLRTARRTAAHIGEYQRSGDIVVVSIHWGPNWGYAVPQMQRDFAHALVDSGCVHCVHGHSSHHPKGIEVYRGRPVLYGCGDFINDYEGISSHRNYRGDLSLMYFLTLNSSDGELSTFQIIPVQHQRFTLIDVSTSDAQWLASVLDREGRGFGTQISRNPDNSLTVNW
jgi:poly-gamma-glutamate synthesis protein (capsule biosynthesis protein)